MLLIIISTYYVWWLSITQLVLFGGYLFLFLLMVSLITKKIAIPFKNHFLTIGFSCLVFVITYCAYLVKIEGRASEDLLVFLILNSVIVWISSFYLVRLFKRYYTDGKEYIINPKSFISRQKDLTKNVNQLEQLSSELASQNKQLTDFANITSHNLRSPMASMTALFELYELEQDKQEKKMLLTKIKEVAGSMNQTVNDLTEIVRVQKGYQTEIQLLSFENVLETVRKGIQNDIDSTAAKIVADFSKAPTIYYPKVYLESILLNLITNAIKYRHPEKSPIISIKTYTSNTEIVFECADNGLGIDLTKHGKDIFALHKTFHGNSDARGVGLYITKNQIESLGGSISVKSQVNKGSTFIITFPQEKL